MNNVTSSPPSPEALDDTWVELVINGQSCRVEAFEALQTLGEVDQRHAADANECLDCSALSGGGESCPHCSGKRLRATRVYRDDLIATMVRELGLPQMSGRTALAIYDRIVGVVESKKNESMTTPESAGTSELTAPPSNPPESEPG